MSGFPFLSARRAIQACIVCIALFTASFAFAEGYPAGSAYVNGGIHWEMRDAVGEATNFDAIVGYDFLIWDGFDLYFGPRVGVFTETVMTAFMGPSLAIYVPLTAGAQLYFLYPSWFSKDLVLTCGGAADFLIYTDALHWTENQPVYTFMEVFLGVRYYIGRLFHIEGRMDAGVFPFFSDVPVVLKFGLQVGVEL